MCAERVRERVRWCAGAAHRTEAGAGAGAHVERAVHDHMQRARVLSARQQLRVLHTRAERHRHQACKCVDAWAA